MSLALEILKNKGHLITKDEEEATKIAILLHDIGHSPFSHSLENYFTNDISHEKMSLLFLKKLNKEFEGKLGLAIDIFQNKYHKKYLYQLISGQLDMDRLDYLRRDSFFTGVSEGIVGIDRIIQMIDIHDNNLVVEAKGIYSIEKFLIARRLMYWQVYFHKTVLIVETVMQKTIEKIKELYRNNQLEINNKHIEFLLKNNNSENEDELIYHFSKIDDFDIFSIIKEYSENENGTLRYLTNSLINRVLPKITLSKNPFDETLIQDISEKIIKRFKIDISDLKYYLHQGKISNNTYYGKEENINILYNNELKDITEISDIFNISVLDKLIEKYYICIPKL
jgi:HD superfamily phosphohydrolase